MAVPREAGATTGELSVIVGDDVAMTLRVEAADDIAGVLLCATGQSTWGSAALASTETSESSRSIDIAGSGAPTSAAPEVGIVDVSTTISTSGRE
jgi:hypothetical protein